MPLFVRGSTYRNILILEKLRTQRVEDLRDRVAEQKKTIELLRSEKKTIELLRSEKKTIELLRSEKETSIINEGRHQLELLPLLQLAVQGIAGLKGLLSKQDENSVRLTEIAGGEIFQLQVRAISQVCAIYAEMAEWVESLIPSLKKSAQGAARKRAESFYRQMHTFLEEYSGLVGKEEQQGEQGEPLFSQSVPPLTEEELAEKLQYYHLASPHQNTPPTATEIGESEEENNEGDEPPPILVGSVVWHTTPEEEEEKLGYE